MTYAIVARLPVRLQPYAKALLPAAGTLAATAVQWALTGEYDRAELTTTLAGLAAAGTAFLFPNIPPAAHDRAPDPSTMSGGRTIDTPADG